jgi:hypothetical protein
MIPYNPSVWYWIIPGVEGEVFSSARPGMVPVTDADYVVFLAGGNTPSRLNPDLSKAQGFSELHEVLRLQAPAVAAAVADTWTKEGYLAADPVAGTRLALTSGQAEIIAKCIGSTAEKVLGSSAEEILAAVSSVLSSLGPR